MLKTTGTIRGFSLIELMIVVVIVGIISVIAYPSYTRYVQRGQQSSGQQFLLDLAQRQEQFFLDNRSYTTTVGAGGLGFAFTCSTGAGVTPCEVRPNYSDPVIAVVAAPPSYVISMAPTGNLAGTGTLYLNSVGQSWREVDGNGVFDPAKDCISQDLSCTPQS